MPDVGVLILILILISLVVVLPYGTNSTCTVKNTHFLFIRAPGFPWCVCAPRYRLDFPGIRLSLVVLDTIPGKSMKN